jgi:uncharacterized protein YdiU (UPF0061 family)
MAPAFTFDNSYARELPGFYVNVQPAASPAPRLVIFNHGLARDLGLDGASLDSEWGARVFSGAEVPEGAAPLAQAYAGHQFGGFSPQLGDGRALLLGEVLDPQGRRFDIQLKGSGRTPFARGGDGKAALGPMLREYIISEAMHALGIPTTRSLAVALTGETIYREQALPGAVLTRVAASHIRIGTFQFFAVRGYTAKLKQLADYAIARHFPELAEAYNPYLALLIRVRQSQASLIARWMGVGFIHGVMNTDNAAISGETIDYGPCAFMNAYDPATVFSSIDEGGRYAFGNQPVLAGWNLARFAEALLPLIDADRDKAVALATEAIETYATDFQAQWNEVLCRKLGLRVADASLAADFLALLHRHKADYTLAFRALSDCADGLDATLLALLGDGEEARAWLGRWRNQLADGASIAMHAVNPKFIPRNHRVEEALVAATAGDLDPLHTLLKVLSQPFEEQPGRGKFASPPEDGAVPYRTFCGT